MAEMRVVRWLGVLYLMVMMGWSPVAPPEHAHESDDHHGDHGVLVHRHAQGHFAGSHETDHPELGEAAGPAVALDRAFILAAAIEWSGPVATAVVLLAEPPGSEGRRVISADVELLIHGPPRAPTGLRAPPALSRL